MEVWQDIPNWVSFYQVSNQGRVRSCDRITNGRYKNMNFKGRILKAGTHKKGYKIVCFTKQGTIRKHFFVHALVALVFIGPRPKGLVIRHLDGNPSNNFVENLKFGTSKENSADIKLHGKQRVLHGANSPSAKLTLGQVKFLRKNRHKKSLLQWALFFKVSTTTIKNIMANKTYVEGSK